MTLSIDDACADDVRVAELCRKYKIECTFYWPVEWWNLAINKGFKPLNFDQANQIANDFEIGSHGVTHRYLTQIRTDEAYREIEDSQIMLQNLFHRRISKFAPPRGYTTPQLAKHTLKFYDSQRLTKGTNLVHIHPNSGANGNIPWRDRYRILRESGITDIECWGHSWEFNKFGLWEELEEFLSETN